MELTQADTTRQRRWRSTALIVLAGYVVGTLLLLVFVVFPLWWGNFCFEGSELACDLPPLSDWDKGLLVGLWGLTGVLTFFNVILTTQNISGKPRPRSAIMSLGATLTAGLALVVALVLLRHHQGL